MSNVAVLPEGRKFFAERVVGTDACINGIYVEYMDCACNSPEGRGPAYFEDLIKKEHAGYGRIAVRDVVLDKDGNIKVTGVFTSSDPKGGRINKDTKIVAATLVYMKDDVAFNDRFLYTALLPTPMKIVKGVYMSITVGITIG